MFNNSDLDKPYLRGSTQFATFQLFQIIIHKIKTFKKPQPWIVVIEPKQIHKNKDIIKAHLGIFFPILPSMASTLTSNSSLLTSSRHSSLSHKKPKFRVLAKKSGPFPPIRLGKPKDDSSSEDGSANSNNPFGFKLGKIPDVTSLIPVVSNNPTSPGLSFGNTRRKDSSTVFVAGATGQAGVRIAQSLLRQGFNVRAGVPDLGSAQELAQLAAQYKVCFFFFFFFSIPQLLICKFVYKCQSGKW